MFTPSCHDFYLSEYSEQITYQNFIQINCHLFHQLTKEGYLDHINNLFNPCLLRNIEGGKPFVFISNEIHLLYQPKQAAFVRMFNQSLKDGIKVTRITIEPDKKEGVIICDITGEFFNQLANSQLDFKLVPETKSEPFLNFLDSAGVVDIPPLCDVILMNFSDYLQFLMKVSLIPIKLKPEEDPFPPHQEYNPNQNTVICSLVNTVSFCITNIYFSAAILNFLNLEFSLTPDNKCFALTPDQFQKAKNQLRNYTYHLIEQQKIGQILDQKITTEKFFDTISSTLVQLGQETIPFEDLY